MMFLNHSNREFFWLLLRRDLRVRYAGSTLGGLWSLIHPLMMIAIYMTIFSTIMQEKWAGGTAPADAYYGSIRYGVHLCAGLIPWLLFSDVLIRSTGTLIENGNFLQKVSFPPLILFASVFCNALFVYGSGYLCFMAILALMGKVPPVTAFAGLGVMVLLGLAAAGLGMILAGLNVFFRDTGQVLTVLMQFLFWFIPIVYYKDRLFKEHSEAQGLVSGLEKIGRTLILFNPLERFISATQSSFGHELARIQSSPLEWWIIFLFPAACLTAGLLLFRRMLPEIRDCL